MVRIHSAVLALTASVGLAGCAYSDYGYGGVSAGYGTGGYYDDYYGSGYAPYYGWYDGFYYPGAGYYVYDRGGHRHRWKDHHKRYWDARRDGRDGRENWRGYRRDGDRDGDRAEWRGRGGGDRGEWRGGQRGDDRADRGDRGNRGDRDNRGQWRDGQQRDGQAYRDGRGRNAPDRATPRGTGRPDPVERTAQRDQRGGNAVSRGNTPRETAAATPTNRPQRTQPQPTTRNPARPAPSNRSQSMRQARDGDGPE